MDKTFVESMKNMFVKGFIEETFKLFDTTWKMRTLNDRESTWRDRFIHLSVSTSFLSERRVPTLAIAIKEINGRPVTEIFRPDSIPVGKEATPTENLINNMLGDENNTPEFLAAEEVRKFLLDLPSKVSEDLYIKYTEMENKSREVLSGVIAEDNFRGQPNGSGPLPGPKGGSNA